MADESQAPVAEAPEEPQTVKEIVAEVRERLEKGEPLIPEEPEEDPDAVQVGEAAEVDVGEQAGSGEAVGGEGEDEGGEVPSPAEGTEAEAGEGEAGEAVGGEEEPDVFTVTLPGRRDGDAPAELDLEGLDDEAKEGFRRLMNEGLRRDQLDSAMEQVRGVQAEIQDVMISMETNPINFVMERTTPELRQQLAQHLMADPDIWEAVVPEIARWDKSQDARDAAAARLERDRIIASQEANTAVARKHESRANAKAIYDHVTGMVPEESTEETQELFVDQAMRVIQQYADQHQIHVLDLKQVEPILRQTHVLRLLGAQAGTGTTTHPTDPSSAGPARPAAPGTSLREAEETAERFRKTSARKRNIAAVAPPGVGPAPAQPPQPPEEVQRSVRESIKWYRKNVLKG